MSKVYLIMEHYDNGEPFEDNYTNDIPIHAFETRMDAENFIKQMPVPNKYSVCADEEFLCEELHRISNSDRWARDIEDYKPYKFHTFYGYQDTLRAFGFDNGYYFETYSYSVLEIPFESEGKE